MAQLEAKEIGRRLAQARNEAGLRQEDVAEMAPFSKRSLQDYEAGVSTPYKHMRFFARLYDRPLDWLLRGDDSAAPVVPEEIIVAVREEIRPLREHVAGLEALLRDLRDRLPEAPSATSGRSRRARSG